MPDGDIFSRVAAPGWSAPLRQLYGGGNPEDVAHAAMRCLARSLREQRGVPGLRDFARIVRQLLDRQCSLLCAFEQLNALELQNGQRRHVRVAVHAMKRLVTEIGTESVSVLDASSTVSQRVCQAIIEHNVFERSAPELADLRFGSEASRLEFERQCWERLDSGISKLGEQLHKRPCGRGIVAPRVRRTRRRSTADLMDEPLT